MRLSCSHWTHPSNRFDLGTLEYDAYMIGPLAGETGRSIRAVRRRVRTSWWTAGPVCAWFLLGGRDWLHAYGGGLLATGVLLGIGAIVLWGLIEDSYEIHSTA